MNGFLSAFILIAFAVSAVFFVVQKKESDETQVVERHGTEIVEN